MAINLSTLVNQTNPVQLAKAWASWTQDNSGNITILSSFNVSSITYFNNGYGNLTVTFTNAFANGNYAFSYGGGVYTDNRLNITTSTNSFVSASINGSNYPAYFTKASLIIFSS